MSPRLVAFLLALAAVLSIGTGVYLRGKAVAKQEAKTAQVEAELADTKATLAEYQNRIEKVQALADQRAKSAARIQTVTKELIREVPVRVPADACPLPDGWRVQHDEAAAGTAPDPTASPGPDGGPVAAQEAAVTVTENYGQYNDLADRHRRLQQYVKEQLK